jgi:hypothetical protein
MDRFMFPPVGFHFSVVFEMFRHTPNEFRFQEVSGLEVDMEMEQVKEGGQNRFYFETWFVHWFRHQLMV